MPAARINCERAALLTRRRVFGDKLPVDLEPEGAARHRQHQMPMQLGRGVRREDGAVLLGELGDAQHLGEAPGAGRKRPR